MVGPEGSDSCRIRYLPPLPSTVVIYYSAGTITVPKNRKGYLYDPGSVSVLIFTFFCGSRSVYHGAFGSGSKN